MSHEYCAKCEASEEYCTCLDGFESGLQKEVDELTAEIEWLRQLLREKE